MRSWDWATKTVEKAIEDGKRSIVAYPFFYDLGDGEWRVWRPDRIPHHFGHYKTQERAAKSADRINHALYHNCL